MVRFRKVDFKPVFRLILSLSLWAAILFFGYQTLSKPKDSSQAKQESEAASVQNKDSGGEASPGLTATSEAKISPDQAKPAQSPQPTATAEAKTNRGERSPVQIIVVGQSQKAEEKVGPEEQEVLPYLKKYEQDGKFSLAAGTVKFSVVANWKYEVDEVLLLMNFNGQDIRNLFRVIGSNNTINFETFDKEGGSGFDELNYYVGEEKDYKGKKYDIKFTWDFGAKVPIKRLYVNGQLVKDSFPESLPTEANTSVYFGNISDLVVTNQWESP